MAKSPFGERMVFLRLPQTLIIALFITNKGNEMAKSPFGERRVFLRLPQTLIIASNVPLLFCSNVTH